MSVALNEYKHGASLFIADTAAVGLEMPVIYDPHVPIYNKGLPVTTITGSPGHGKTMAGQIICAHAALLGKTVAAIDYKGDLLKLYSLKEELGVPIKLWNIADRKRAGMLDPFVMTSKPSEQLALALDLISLFLGGLDRTDRADLSPLIKDVAEGDSPSMMKVLQKLKSSAKSSVQGIGEELDVIRQQSYAHICFNPSVKRRAQKESLVDGGLTIATLAGMDLPQDADEAQRSVGGRLASGILFLLTDYVRRLMFAASDRPKLFVIDEAWSVLSTDAGRQIVKEVSLLGRSKSLATVLITQRPDHITEAKIDNTIGCRFAFKGDKRDAKTLAEDMDLPEGYEEMISTTLPKYYCLMQDWDGRFGVIKFSSWRPDWMEAFSTDPYALMEKKKNAKLAAARKKAADEAKMAKYRARTLASQ